MTEYQLSFDLHPRTGPAFASFLTVPRYRNEFLLKECNMPISLGTILLIVLILLLLGAIPTWPHSRAWGYGPSGGLGLVLVIVLILVLLRMI
jgi:hypothetical protein